MALKRDEHVRHHHKHRRVCRPSLSLKTTPTLRSTCPSGLTITASSIQSASLRSFITQTIVPSKSFSISLKPSSSSIKSFGCNTLATPVTLPGFKFTGTNCFPPPGIVLESDFFTSNSLKDTLEHCAKLCVDFGEFCGQFYASQGACYLYFFPCFPWIKGLMISLPDLDFSDCGHCLIDDEGLTLYTR